MLGQTMKHSSLWQAMDMVELKNTCKKKKNTTMIYTSAATATTATFRIFDQSDMDSAPSAREWQRQQQAEK